LKELLKTQAAKETEEHEKHVFFFIGLKEYEFSGAWQWDLQSDAVYCSDVMFPFPAVYEGTKGIIHPDDKILVQDRIATASSTVPFLQFRIITTYGEVKLLTGRALQFCELATTFAALQEVQEPIKEVYELSKQAQKLQWQMRAAALAERATTTGSWYLNTATAEMFYSDGIYGIHSLPAQSLNAHLHTFSSFIHHDDRDMVRDVQLKAVRHKLPLHIEYRIVLAGGTEKKLRQTTHWEFTEKGALMLYGSVTDMTYLGAAERRAEAAEHELSLKYRILQMNEQATNTGYWYINLLTRKIAYSDNVFRLHGLKPKSVPPGINIFLNYIHHEDREVVKEVTKKITHSQEPPDIDYRIVRNDGTIRYLRQRGKMVVYGDGEMIMVVSLEDITKDRAVVRKAAEANEAILLKNFINNQLETAAIAGSWIWDVESGAVTWSDGLYQLLGYKATAVTLTPKSFLRFIHTDDRKTVTDSIELLLHEKKEMAFSFRIIRLGEERFVKASFRLVANSARQLFIATFHDVTAGQHMKEQLTKEVQLAESISQNIQDTVIITDDNNNIVLWNKAAEAQFGVKRDDALHKNFFDVLPSLKDEQTLTQFNQVLKGQGVFLQAARSVQAKTYHNLTRMPLRNDEGTVSGILHLLHDVTKEQEMEQRLTERLNFIESLLEASVDRIVVLDRHMNYLYCNKKAAEHFGIDKEELIGKNVLEVFPASISNPSYEYFRRALQGETVHIPAIDGLLDEHYGQVYLIPVSGNTGEVSAIMWIRQDLSGEIKLQRQLKKSDDILNTINAAFIELDEDFHIKYINPTGELFFGRPKEFILGEVLWEAFPQMINTKGYEAVLKAVGERLKVEVEYFSVVFNKLVFMSVTPSADGVIILFYDRQDIKEAQQNLQEEHRRMHEAQAIGCIGSFEWTVGGKEALWSDELYRINGIKPQSERITEARVDALIHPEDLKGLQELKEQCFVTPGFYKLVHRIINPDGVVKWVNHQFESTANAQGKVVRVHGTVQDITEQRKREAQIVKTLSVLQQSEDLAQIGSWEYDIASGDFTWSDGMYDLFSLPKGKKVAPPIYQSFALREDRDIANRIVDNIQNSYQSFDEIVRIKKGDEVRILKVKSNVISNDGGQPLKIVGVDLDITDSIEAEKKIQESRHLLQQTTAATPDAITLFNLETKQPNYLNSCLANWLGYTNAQLMEMGCEGRLELIHPEDRQALLSFQEVMLGVTDGAIKTIEYRVQTKGGDYLWLRNRGKVFKRNKEGKVTEILGVLQDITEEKKRGGELENLNASLAQKNKELEVKNEEITNFAFIASHDLKEPIRKLHTFSNWLMEKEVDGLSVKGKEFVYKMDASVKRIDILIQDIIMLTKLQALKEAQEEVSLNTVLSEAVAELGDRIKETTAVIESAGLPVVTGSKRQLLQLFKNIISNGIKFQQPGVTPVVEIKAATAPGTGDMPPGQYINICFTDNGIGFDQKYAAKIFMVFQRLHAQTQYSGTGIGLAICKKIMENHKGFITAESAPGRGATFCCYFPV
jgi:PAS domain S-box-containing protein